MTHPYNGIIRKKEKATNTSTTCNSQKLYSKDKRKKATECMTPFM